MVNRIRFLSTTLFAAALFCAACGPGGPAEEAVEETAAPTITISPDFPSDIPGGAPNADLQTASVFAWQEFISLNWPAVPQTGALDTRDTADSSKTFGDPSYDGPLSWETYRHKVEIFPGQGNPNGYVDDPAQSYGYDAAPQYIYDSSNTGNSDGTVSPCPSQSSGGSVPYVNLDEINEIGQNEMFAGVAPQSPDPGQQFLYLAKANRSEYNYVYANGFLGSAPTSQTAAYVNENKASPPAGDSSLVSFPNGTVELKSAWRLLSSSEQQSGHFHTATVRFYLKDDSTGFPCYEDAVFGMAALHIIHKTPSAPYFIFATFEQADNILTSDGQPVEDADGNIIANQGATPFNPAISSKNATFANPADADSIQSLSPSTADCQPGQELYFRNTPSFATTQGTICVNRRVHDIPQTVIDVNASAHQSIQQYNTDNNIPSSPWLYYKLVNVQYEPMTIPTPGQTYTGADAATYYQANSVVETNYNLQVFSGQFQPSTCPDGVTNPDCPPGQPDPKLAGVNVQGLITDFNISTPNQQGTEAFSNTFYMGTAFNMGGCMGCHGNAQVAGTDFSFIFPYRVGAPETPGDLSPESQTLRKYRRLLRLLQ